MNDAPKPVYRIQQNPKGEWLLTKGAVRLSFATEEDAMNGMTKWINSKTKEYDAEGKLIFND